MFFRKFIELSRRVYSSSKDQLINLTGCKPPCTYYKYSLVDTFVDGHEWEIGKSWIHCQLWIIALLPGSGLLGFRLGQGECQGQGAWQLQI